MNFLPVHFSCDSRFINPFSASSFQSVFKSVSSLASHLKVPQLISSSCFRISVWFSFLPWLIIYVICISLKSPPETTFSGGNPIYSALSPRGRSNTCYPDPEVHSWYRKPGSQLRSLAQEIKKRWCWSIDLNLWYLWFFVFGEKLITSIPNYISCLNNPNFPSLFFPQSPCPSPNLIPSLPSLRERRAKISSTYHPLKGKSGCKPKSTHFILRYLRKVYQC